MLGLRLLPAAIVAFVTLSSACSSTANISEVYTTLDGAGARRRNVFFTDTKEIHCLGEAGIGRPDATIEAYIRQIVRYNFKTNEYDSSSERVLGYLELNPQRSAGGVPLKIDIQLLKIGPDGKQDQNAAYEAGSYVCEMFLDGELGGKAAFNIDFPPCPPTTITPGSPCLGFYPAVDETVCPRYGFGSNEDSRCQCKAAGWQCDPD